MLPAELASWSFLRTRGYVNGIWCGADNGAAFAVHSPSTGEHLADVPDMGREETRRAIEAAAAAWPAWRAMTAKERAVPLRAWFSRIMAHRE